MASALPVPPGPETPAAQLSRLGARLGRAARHDEAVVAYEAARALAPDWADLHNSLGAAYHRAGRLPEAIAAYHRALELNPGHLMARSNLGMVHMDRNEPVPAIAAFRRALELNPVHPKIRTNLAFAQLLNGDLLAGWRHYENRWAAGARRRRPRTRRPWLGDRSIAGRSILLCSEQGFGDVIQFARYVPQVVGLGARVHLEVEAPLYRLFQASFPEVAALHPAEGPVPDCDEYCLIPSLPLAFRTELNTVPAAVPYLRPPEQTPGRWPQIARNPGGLRIGLAWSGNPRHHNDRNRSMPFARLQPLVERGPNVFVSLQPAVRDGDQAALVAARRVVVVADRLSDFADTAALIAELDLVIAVDTAVAHLAGALGKPVWLLLPYAPDWRWLLERGDSPWYPTMELFRQPRAGDWDAVIARLQDRLGAGVTAATAPGRARR